MDRDALPAGLLEPAADMGPLAQLAPLPPPSTLSPRREPWIGTLGTGRLADLVAAPALRPAAAARASFQSLAGLAAEAEAGAAAGAATGWVADWPGPMTSDEGSRTLSGVMISVPAPSRPPGAKPVTPGS
ncbi:MAG: hypothetical protein WC943_07605 [Elusimicrobiota bacterium]